MALLAGIGVGLGWWWFSNGDDGQPGDARNIPFTLKATVRVADSEPTGGTTISAIEWTWRDAAHWQWTIARDGKMAARGVADGSRTWLYSGGEGTYRELPIDGFGDGRALPISLVIGPTGQSSLAGVAAWLQTTGGFDRVETGGTSSVAGMPCSEIRVSPTWRGESGSASSTGTATSVARSGGEAMLCVEPEHFFVLRNRMTGVQEALAEVTELRFEAPAPESFRFEPPPGAQRVP